MHISHLAGRWGVQTRKVEGRTVHKSEGSSVSGVRSGRCESGGQSVTHTEIRVGGGVFPDMTDHVTITLPVSIFFCTVTQQKSHSKLLRSISGSEIRKIRVK